jgi:prolyl-tRNA synthetase
MEVAQMSENRIVSSVADQRHDEAPMRRASKKQNFMQQFVVVHDEVEATQRPSAAALTNRQMRCDS